MDDKRSTQSTDRIEKQVVIQAPRSRVWRAVTDSKEFGTWFRAEFEGPFVVGTTVHGRSTYEGYEHVRFDTQIVEMEPERRFALRWYPGNDVPEDPASAPTTLVEFTLEDADGGTRLTVVESGFEELPPALRASSFRENQRGWEMQMENVRAHVED